VDTQTPWDVTQYRSEQFAALPLGHLDTLCLSGEEIEVLTEYLNAAMAHAEYEDLRNEGWYGRIPSFDGLWAIAPTLEETRQELRSSLEDWILIGLTLNHPLPVVADIDLNVQRVAQCHTSGRLEAGNN
jgi:predicted RNase H-like HicB family nuclease